VQPKIDFVTETFAKFGLSMNMYANPDSLVNMGGGGGVGFEDMKLDKAVKGKLGRLIDSLPNYGYLLDNKLTLP
jgi:hypothetical protein